MVNQQKNELVLARRSCQHCDIHYAPFKGRSYKVTFDNGKLVLPNGDTCRMSGSLDAPITFGDNLHYDFEAIAAEEKDMFKWAESIGLIEPGTKWWKGLKDAEPQFVASIFCPGIPLDKVKLLARTMLLLFWLDDIVDIKSHTGRSTEFSYSDIISDLNNLASCLTVNSLTDKPRGKAIPTLEAACNAISDLRSIAISTGIDPQFYFESFALYIRHCAIQASQTNLDLGLIEYTYIRDKTHGGTLSMEVILLLHKVQLTKQHRNDPLISLFFHLSTFHVAVVNDILGIRKELESGEDINIVVVKYKNAGDLQAAFDQSVQEANSIKRKLIQLKERIFQQFPQDGTVQKAVELGLNCANGHILNYVQSKRYENSHLNFEIE